MESSDDEDSEPDESDSADDSGEESLGSASSEEELKDEGAVLGEGLSPWNPSSRNRHLFSSGLFIFTCLIFICYFGVGAILTAAQELLLALCPGVTPGSAQGPQVVLKRESAPSAFRACAHSACGALSRVFCQIYVDVESKTLRFFYSKVVVFCPPNEFGIEVEG